MVDGAANKWLQYYGGGLRHGRRWAVQVVDGAFLIQDVHLCAG